MKKITEEAIRAFTSGSAFHRGNTSVRVKNGRVSLHLFGNRIAYQQDGQLFISTCGWQSDTTKERLNGLPGVAIHQKNFIWYLNDKAWDGTEINLSEWGTAND